MSAGVTPGRGALRGLVREQLGFDPGPLRSEDQLDAIGIGAIERLQLIASLEERYGVAFPADLIAALETVDDLVHYTALKVAQAQGEPASGGRP